jgi:hypothetical protein
MSTIIRCPSSNAGRTRTAWFPVIVKLCTSYDCHIGWKYSDNTVGLFSTAVKTSKTRPPWGALIVCKLEKRTNAKQESNEYFTFENEKNSKVSFKAIEMNQMVWQINCITQKISSLRSQKKIILLALFLHLLCQSEGFTGYNEETFNKLGTKKDGTGVQVKDLEENGGSLSQLEDFINKAKECAVCRHCAFAKFNKEKKR